MGAASVKRIYYGASVGLPIDVARHRFVQSPRSVAVAFIAGWDTVAGVWRAVGVWMLPIVECDE